MSGSDRNTPNSGPEKKADKVTFELLNESKTVVGTLPATHGAETFCVLSNRRFAAINPSNFRCLEVYDSSKKDPLFSTGPMVGAVVVLDKDHLIYAQQQPDAKMIGIHKLNINTGTIEKMGTIDLRYAMASTMKLLSNNIVAIGTYNGELIIYDMEKNEQLLIFRTSSQISSITFSNDKQSIIILSTAAEFAQGKPYHYVSTFNLLSKKLQTYPNLIDLSTMIPSPMVLLDNDRIVMGGLGDYGFVYVIDLLKGEQHKITLPESCYVTALEVLPNNTLVIGSGANYQRKGPMAGTIWFYDPNTLEKIGEVHLNKSMKLNKSTEYQFHEIAFDPQTAHLLCHATTYENNRRPENTVIYVDVGIANMLRKEMDLLGGVFGGPKSIIMSYEGWTADTLQAAQAASQPSQPASVDAQPRNVEPKQQSAPAQQTTVDAKQQSAPAQQTTVDAKQQSSPAQQTTVDAKQQSAPAQQTTVDAKQQSSTAEAEKNKVGAKEMTRAEKDQAAREARLKLFASKKTTPADAKHADKSAAANTQPSDVNKSKRDP